MKGTLMKPMTAAFLLALRAAGCAGESQPSRFYVLSYPSSDGSGEATTTKRAGLGLGIGPVALPQYLDRPQIVRRSDGNRLELEEFDRWGGRLGENFVTVLAEVLSDKLQTDRVSVYPWSRPEEVEYQVIVNVTAFETDESGQSVLDARWTIIDARRQSVLSMARTSLREVVAEQAALPDQGVDYDAAAAAMSRNVAELGDVIAEEIQALAAR